MYGLRNSQDRSLTYLEH